MSEPAVPVRLANEKPGTGNPTMSDSTHLAKEIKVAIDLKVGNTPANADDFFGGDGDDSSQSSPAAGAAPPAASPAVDPPTAAASVPLVITATTAATNNVTAITNATTGTKKNSYQPDCLRHGQQHQLYQVFVLLPHGAASPGRRV